MTGTTPLYALPYPVNADTLKSAVQATPQALAQQVEATIAGFGGIAAPGSWQTPSYAAGVANLGAPWALGRYRKVGNTVKLRGALSFPSGLGTGVTMFTLPVGFRPSSVSPAGQVMIPCASSAAGLVTPVYVSTAGAVVSNGALAAGGYLILDAIEFDVD